jgi:hypothetical protein
MTTTTTPEKQPKKASSVRHTRAIQRDRTKRPLTAPSDEQVAARLTEIITRAKTNLAYHLERTLVRTAHVHDLVIWIGPSDDRQLVRLIAVLHRGKWYRYLTNELDPERLPTEYVVALYWQRWRIEDAYAIVKRLLGLAYFWCGSQNAVQLQVWATWLLHAVLLDLTDALAEALHQPLAALSMEMVYRSLYFFTQAYHRGEADEAVIYLAANAKLFGILKRPRKRAGPLSARDILPLTVAANPSLVSNGLRASLLIGLSLESTAR